MRPEVVRWTLAGVDKVVAISRNVERSLLTVGVRPSRVAVIPPAIDDRRFLPQADREAARNRVGLTGNDPLLLFVGNMTETKGLDVLLRATQGLAGKFPKIRLVCTLERGPGISARREADLRALIMDLGIGTRVIELGVVSDMPDLMAACDVFVLPYRSTDGPSDYPLAMLEAMAVGRPVVATRVGAIPEIVRDGETGWLVASDSPEELSRAVAFALTHPLEAHAVGAAATQAIRGRFGGASVAQEVRKLYLRVLEQTKGRAE